MSVEADTLSAEQTLCPFVDFSAPPLLDVEEIKKILPHRPPNLFVDFVWSMDLDRGEIIATKCFPEGDEVFTGHYPDYPLLRGTNLTEAMAQVGAILLLSDPENHGKYPLNKGNSSTYDGQVRPGDKIVILVRKSECPDENPKIKTGKAYAFVNGECVGESTLMCRLMKQPRAK